MQDNLKHNKCTMNVRMILAIAVTGRNAATLANKRKINTGATQTGAGMGSIKIYFRVVTQSLWVAGMIKFIEKIRMRARRRMH